MRKRLKLVSKRTQHPTTIKLACARSSYRKVKGLMFKKDIKPYCLKTRFGIHTFFVREPIDIVILDKSNAVIKTKTSIKPFRVFFWNPKFDRVLELPKGFITKKKLSIGTKIKIICT